MQNRDLDKNIESGRSGDVGSNRSRNRTSGSDMGSSGGSGDRMRNRGDGNMEMPDERGGDLQEKQSEGNLGNERVRGAGE